jgi:hypothetical protein
MSRAEVAAARELLRRRTANAWLSSRGRPVAPDLEPSVRRQFQEAFGLLDSDGSGTLSEAEVYQGFCSLGLPTSRAAVRQMVRAMTDESGAGVTYAGFERLMAARREELPKHGARHAGVSVALHSRAGHAGSAAPPVPLEVMARSLRRAKLLNAVLQEREAAIADYRRRAAATAAAREAEEHAASVHHHHHDHAASSDETLDAEDDWTPAPPPGLRDDDDEARPAEPQADDEQPAFVAFAPRKPQRRRSVLVCVGDLQKLVEL